MGSPSSSSVPEIVVPVSSQKHDLAWKHCLMIKKGEKIHLKCMYCVKVFSGGGIHRIKEHLACQKGNASSCSKVPPDVQYAMLQSLESVVVRKKKKQRLAEEVKKLNPVVSPTYIQPYTDSSIPLLALPVDPIDTDFYNQNKKEEFEAVVKSIEKGRRKRQKSSLAQLSGCLVIGQNETGAGLVRDRDQICMAIGRFMYEVGVPLDDAVNSVHLQTMIDTIVSAGSRIDSPSYGDLRGWILKNSLKELNNTLEKWKASWGRTGCTILVDEWTTEMDRTFINFLVYCPEGTMFLKSVDASEIITSADALYELLRHVVEEVGLKNVVQVITNNSETHALAGKRLETFPTLFWSPCSAKCIDLMLDDIGKLDDVSVILEQAKSITSFIYNNSTVLNMTRKYTGGNDLVHPSISCSATNFTTLNRICSLKDNLQAMIVSQEWEESWYSKEPGAILVAGLINSSSFWSSCLVIVHITEPLVRALIIADSNTRPAMGYIYMSMQCAKKRIRRELKKKSYYMPYWNIIDWRWGWEFTHPLHMAGFFLNPQFFYKIQGDIPNKIMSGMLDCIERLVPDLKVQDKINQELSLYKSAAGDFGRKMAIRARNVLLPAEWWSTYGGGCPNLCRLAIRVLSQTCSSKGYRPNHIPFVQILTQRMNSLEHQRLSDSIFLQYNLRLQQKKTFSKRSLDPISIDNLNLVEDWIVEKSDLFTRGDESSWMHLAQPLVNGMIPQHVNVEDADPFTTGFDEDEISSTCDEVEEEEDDDDNDAKEDEHEDDAGGLQGIKDEDGSNNLRRHHHHPYFTNNLLN